MSGKGRKRTFPKANSSALRKRSSSTGNKKLNAARGGGTRSRTPQRSSSSRRGRRSSKGPTRRRAKSAPKSGVYPKWFKDFLKLNVPTQLTGLGSGRMQNDAEQCYYSIWCDHTPIMYDNAIITGQGAGAAVAGPNSTTNTQKTYLYNVSRIHRWRNNTSFTACKLYFYKCWPRRDETRSVLGGGAQQPSLSPVNSNAATGTGVFLKDPVLVQQGTTDDVVPPTVTGIAGFTFTGSPENFTDPAVSPYKLTKVVASWKVKPLKVKWPSGKVASAGELLSGQSVEYRTQRRKPMLLSRAKFGLSNVAANEGMISNTYAVLRTTPIILLRMQGTVSHSVADDAKVSLGSAEVDYRSDWTYNVLRVFQASVMFGTYTNGDAIVTDPEQANEMDGKMETEVVTTAATHGPQVLLGEPLAVPPTPSLSAQMEEALKFDSDDIESDEDVE